MAVKKKESDSFLLDTYRSSVSGMYIPGAVTFAGCKRMVTYQWKDQQFPTQQEADSFARRHFLGLSIQERSNEGELRSSRSRYSL
jgi:hypothetical protein